MLAQQRNGASPTRRSSYLRYLPPPYSQNDFVGRFLGIFEGILGPLEATVDNVAHYFDPLTTPEDLLPWLASWVDLVLDEGWPIERRRELIRSATELYQWRGTSRGLKEYIRVYTGVEPEIIENFGGIRLSADTLLGWNTVLGDGHQYTFSVTVELEDPSSVDVDKVKAIIESEKPAHTAYVLRVVSADDDR